MRIIKASAAIETPKAVLDEAVKAIERAGRTCYKSEDHITEDSAGKFIKMILDPSRKHESVIEHQSVTVRFIVDRGISHEIVRHRLASYSQESTRYCNYNKEKFGKELTFIDPRPHLHDGSEPYRLWLYAMEFLGGQYFGMINSGVKPQMARSILPNSLKTEVVMTANLREWRHFFAMRTQKAAHPQMREVACPLLADFRAAIPVIFDDVGTTESCI